MKFKVSLSLSLSFSFQNAVFQSFARCLLFDVVRRQWNEDLVFILTSIKSSRNESRQTISQTTSSEWFVSFFFFVAEQNSKIEDISLDPNCDRRSCQPPNCGKDFVAAALPGECCEKCVPWEYAASLGIQYPQAPAVPQPAYDPRAQPAYPYQQYNQAPQYQPQRVDVYIFGPDDGARVSTGQSIYFDCEVVSPYNQYAQPRWSRAGNQVSENDQ